MCFQQSNFLLALSSLRKKGGGGGNCFRTPLHLSLYFCCKMLRPNRYNFGLETRFILREIKGKVKMLNNHNLH